ncbi:unnamed protein product [Owenia fusiformis]|uniref:RNA polymerase II subunit A C-terminal domain phosphatase n=1 Tax=Owenia fusiformis TaxID=6347 RepID=A0A8J1Y7A0_OWEFU|nr:unnamed protein product [Owenia fusiformis]
MEAKLSSVFMPGDVSAKLVTWKVKKGAKVGQGTTLAVYAPIGGKGTMRLRASNMGTVHELLVQEGSTVQNGKEILKLQGCLHPIVMKDMCAECGADLRKDSHVSAKHKETVDSEASVRMVHNIPELVISKEQAQELGKADEERLTKARKLVLLVDLDQTLIHTTNDNVAPNLKDVKHFQLRHGQGKLWYHTKFRPHTEQFLEKISKMYELHICTFGVRAYAHTIARFLDPDGKYFSHRILSRDECFSSNSKTANLGSLFPCGDAMVCIIDDREDVWNFAPNLVHVKPYKIFKGTADINAPPGVKGDVVDDDPLPEPKSVDLKHEIEDSKAALNGELSDSTGPSNINESDTGKTSDSSISDDSAVTNETTETKDANESKYVGNEEEPSDPTVSIDATLESTNANDNVAPEVKDLKDSDSKDLIKRDDSTSDEVNKVSVTDTLSDDLKMEDDEAEDEEKTTSSDSVDKAKDTQVDEVMKDDEIKPESAEVDETKKDETIETSECITEILTPASDGQNVKEEDLIEMIDDDDHLHFLEEKLTKIHEMYFKKYDLAIEKSEKDLPNLKQIIPEFRANVLKECCVLFSGVFPTNFPPEKSRAYTVAKALGAKIHTNFVSKADPRTTERTTHVMAAKLGTAKVNQAKKQGGIWIVTPDWLWSCEERWEKVDERLFKLTHDISLPFARNSPDVKHQREKRKAEDQAQKGSPPSKQLKVNNSGDANSEQLEAKDIEFDDEFGYQAPVKQKTDTTVKPAVRERRKFSDEINPLYSFSKDQLSDMDKEVEDIFDESDSSNDSTETANRIRKKVLSGESDSESSVESMSGEFPKGWGIAPKRKRNDTEETEGSLKLIEGVESDRSDNSDYDDSIGSVDEEIANAVEREFLS